ncbi:MAG TPA: hypothetical protein VHK88_16915, partial [Aquihabitans sp.]|nr:hypothetical protein [Aquihabitans sp.]
MQRHRATTATRAPARARRIAVAVALSAVALSPVGVASAAPVAPHQAPEAGVEPPRTPEEQAEAERVRAETLALAPDEPASPDDVFAAVVDAEQAVTDASLARMVAAGRAGEARAAAFDAAVVRIEAEEVVADAVRARDRAKAVLADERDRLSDLTVKAYVTGDVSGEDLRALVEGDTTDPLAGRTVIFEQVLERQEDVTDRARKAANATRKALAAAREDLEAAEAVEADRRRTADKRSAAEAAAVRAHEDALGRLAAAEARLRAGSAGVTVPQEVAIIGMPRLSAGDLASWFATSPYTPRVATPIEDYARWFIEEGTAEGIRG